jgi:branched-chain amino acid aminotransferase
VTRDSVLDIAHDLELPIAEGLLTRYDFYTADECFMTGTGAEIVPVVRLDGRRIGSGSPGPVTAQIREQFATLCRCDGVTVKTCLQTA